MNARASFALLVTLLTIQAAPALAATPAPAAPNAPVAMPSIHPPTTVLHAEYIVEVNKKGQVVRVKSAKASANQTFNVQTYGNALQMWIRKPDGSATVGLFKVTYDYDPKTRAVSRGVDIVSAGGDWGDEEGAANVMMDTARREALEAQHKQQQQGSNLPSLHQIRGESPSPSPSP